MSRSMSWGEACAAGQRFLEASTRPMKADQRRALLAWQRGRITDAQLEAVFGPHIWKRGHRAD